MTGDAGSKQPPVVPDDMDPQELLRALLRISPEDAEKVREDAARAVTYGPAGEYVVKAAPWKHGLELEIVGVGVTQTHEDHPADAETMVRDYLHLMFDRPADSFRIRIEYVDALDED